MQLSGDQLKKMMPNASGINITRFIGPLNETLQRFDINTPRRQAAFIAQITHESGSLKYVKEIASGQAYDIGALAVRLGNTPEDDDDGERYKGRGLIQLTGTANYRKASEYFGVDFLKNPELLEQPRWAALVSGWYWHRHNLNNLADVGDFRKITIKINGGLNGYQDRLKHYERCKKVLGI